MRTYTLLAISTNFDYRAKEHSLVRMDNARVGPLLELPVSHLIIPSSFKHFSTSAASQNHTKFTDDIDPLFKSKDDIFVATEQIQATSLLMSMHIQRSER